MVDEYVGRLQAQNFADKHFERAVTLQRETGIMLRSLMPSGDYRKMTR